MNGFRCNQSKDIPPSCQLLFSSTVSVLGISSSSIAIAPCACLLLFFWTEEAHVSCLCDWFMMLCTYVA